MRARALGAAAFSLGVLLSAVAPSHAQTLPPTASPPPLPGYMPPYEISKIVRAAGFDPLSRPLREGTTYVVRATDFRGILMRVVVDAQSGAIRAVNRIVAGPGSYGAIGMLPPSYDAPPPYGPPEFGSPEIVPGEERAAPVAPTPAALHPAIHPLLAEPPLPRPRPAELAARDARTSAKSGETPAVKPDAKSGVTAAAPSAAAPSPNKPPPTPMNE